MADYYPPSAHWPRSNPTQPSGRWPYANNFWTMLHHRTRPFSRTRQATWSLPFTVMHPTFFKPKACSQAGSHMFMASDDKIPKNNGAVLNILQIIYTVMSSSARRPNLAPSSSMQRRPYPCNKHLKIWAICNCGCRFKWTIPLPLPYSPTRFSQRP